MAKIGSSVIIGCWLIFLVFWTITALAQKKATERQSWLASLPYRALVTLGAFLLCSRKWPWPLNLALTPSTQLAWLIGATVCGFGLFVTLWARVTLAGNWSSNVTFKQGHELIKTGPYRFVRHPIYTGLLLMCLGTAIPPGQLRCWLGLLVMGLGLWVKLKHEETLMLRHFPDAYPAYQKQVKALVPFLI